MGAKYGDFTFDKGFGFTGSASPGYARGGSVQPKGKEPTITMPVSTAQTLAKGLTAIGAQHGAAAAAGALRGPTVGGPMSATPGPQAPAMQPGGGAPPPAPGPGPAMMAKGGHMNAAKRNSLPKGDFAGPDRSYPINDANHARAALSRASGKPVEARVRAAVHRKFPDIGSK